MVSTYYIKAILDEYKITQEELANEWSKTAGVDKYQSNMTRILTKNETTDSLSLLKAISNITKIKLSDLVNEISLKDQKILYHLNETEGDYTTSNIQIPITNIRSTASALMTSYNPSEQVEGSVSIPKTWIKSGTHKIAEITGESMLSTFSPNDLVASRLLEHNEWQDMRDNYIYEIVTNDNDSYIKRVRCNYDRGFITCMSDNLDKNRFPNFNIDISQISQIWSIEFKISWKFPSPYSAIDDRFKQLEQDRDEIQHIIQGLFNEMKKLKN